MNYTSIEQSKKLLELGLNSDSADMYYFLDPTPVGNIYIPSLIFIEKHLKSRMPEYDKGDIPCWSLGALLEIMPKRTEFNGIDYSPMLIPMTQTQWLCRMFCNGVPSIQGVVGDTPLEAAYSMVVWLLENGYIKTIVSNNT